MNGAPDVNAVHNEEKDILWKLNCKRKTKTVANLLLKLVVANYAYSSYESIKSFKWNFVSFVSLRFLSFFMPG